MDCPAPSFTFAQELIVDQPVFLEVEEDEDNNVLTNEDEAVAAMMDLGIQPDI